MYGYYRYINLRSTEGKASWSGVGFHDFEIRSFGGDQQMGSRIVDGQIDYLFFFTDPMTLQPHDTDVKALTRLAGVENIVFCCNRSTADHIISSPLFMDPDYERIHPDYSSYTKRFQNKPVVTEAVEAVDRRKKKRK